MALDSEFKAKWIAALRSGKYEKGVGELHPGNKYCCLGVVCVAIGKRIPPKHQQPIYNWLDGLGVPTDELWRMNDTGRSFAEIADFIEANL